MNKKLNCRKLFIKTSLDMMVNTEPFILLNFVLKDF